MKRLFSDHFETSQTSVIVRLVSWVECFLTPALESKTLKKEISSRFYGRGKLYP